MRRLASDVFHSGKARESISGQGPAEGGRVVGGLESAGKLEELSFRRAGAESVSRKSHSRANLTSEIL